MAQTSDGPPPQTLHAQSEPTTSVQLRKFRTQLNTLNIFVPDLVRASPNASDVQRLGQCVPALWPIHTAQTQTNSQLPLSDHSVVSHLTHSAEKVH